MMLRFSAQIEIIGINPFVLLPETVLTALFEKAGKSKGPIPVRGRLNGHDFRQTLVKFSGHLRLYLNTPMRKNAGIDVGDMANVEIEHDPEERKIEMPENLKSALDQNEAARKTFESLPPSRQSEIVRYIAHLKTEAAVEKNVARAIRFLTGGERFIGRDKP